MESNVEFSDTEVCRVGSGAVKWDRLDILYRQDSLEKIKKQDSFLVEGDKGDLIPLSIADQEFLAPKCIQDAVHARVSHGVFGYSCATDAYYAALQQWEEQHHNFTVDRKSVVLVPGAVCGLSAAVHAWTNVGDKVIIQSPVYYPFFDVIRNSGRQVVVNQLLFDESTAEYSMNYQELEEQAADSRVKLLFLCSPHNPVGRVWTRAELEQLLAICLKHSVFVVSDEVWNDLVYTPSDLPLLNDLSISSSSSPSSSPPPRKEYPKHTVFSTLSETAKLNSAVIISASKTFNLAGLQCANVCIANSPRRKDFHNAIDSFGLFGVNAFGISAALGAFSAEGDQWRRSLVRYLWENLTQLRETLTEMFPRGEIRLIEPQALYVCWLDCRVLLQQRNWTSDQLMDELLLQGRIGLENGTIFGPGGEGFLRLNNAIPKSTLTRVIVRLKAVLGNSQQ